MSESKWLVGSSRIRKFDGVSIVLTRAALFFVPPERCSAVSSGFSIPNCNRRVLACPLRFIYSSSALFPSTTLSSTLLLLSNTGVCGRYAILSFPFLVILPSSASSSPARHFNSVDFPVPFTPMSPILSPSFIPKLMKIYFEKNRQLKKNSVKALKQKKKIKILTQKNFPKYQNYWLKPLKIFVVFILIQRDI